MADRSILSSQKSCRSCLRLIIVSFHFIDNRWNNRSNKERSWIVEGMYRGDIDNWKIIDRSDLLRHFLSSHKNYRSSLLSRLIIDGVVPSYRQSSKQSLEQGTIGIYMNRGRYISRLADRSDLLRHFPSSLHIIISLRLIIDGVILSTIVGTIVNRGGHVRRN